MNGVAYLSIEDWAVPRLSDQTTSIMVLTAKNIMRCNPTLLLSKCAHAHVIKRAVIYMIKLEKKLHVNVLLVIHVTKTWSTSTSMASWQPTQYNMRITATCLHVQSSQIRACEQRKRYKLGSEVIFLSWRHCVPLGRWREGRVFTYSISTVLVYL